MEQAVVVSAARTPVGRYGGVFRDIKASTLLSYAVKAAVERANIDPGVVDEVVVGHVLANGENPNVARLGWLEAGFPIEVPAYTLDRQCGSGLQAIVNAGLLIQTGDAQVVVAGGVESESTAEYYVTNARWGYRLGDGQFYDRIARAGFKVSCPEAFPPVEGMMHTSEKLADRYQITREEADQLAVRSHQNAIAAIEAGKFRQEIVPVPVKQPKVGMVAIDTDEGPRKETSPEALAKLPVLAGRIHTAGNASSINDGAAAVVVMTESKARELGLEPRLYFRGYAAAGVDPTIMGIGPVPAVRKVMAKTGLCLDQ
ncbi:MAG TPA: acetyl-CoA C-acyltransferase, partial [Chloroflexota bacterium]|nr:acetyl-CoA C-acyltransferase [Chloroflexota bacterium]